MPLNRGDRLGRYEIVESIGAGGMGEVFNDGRHLVFSASEGSGPSLLWKVARGGGEPVRLCDNGASASGVSIARRGSRLAFISHSGKSGIKSCCCARRDRGPCSALSIAAAATAT